MAELDVAPVAFRVRANQTPRIGVTRSTGAKVILVPVPGPKGEAGAQGLPGEGVPILGETPSGAINGINKVFSTASTFRADSTSLYLNGLRESHYTETGGSSVTLSDAPMVGDEIRIDYIIE
jgi:hypothetical protein